MALNDNAVFTAAKGFVYTAPVGSESPTPTSLADFDPEVFGNGASTWELIGHTAEEDLPEFGYEGGDKESKGTWQKKNLKEVTTEALVDYVTLKLNQFDLSTFELYYGKNKSSEPGVFAVDSGDNPAVERAILIVIQDGDYTIGFTAAKASVRRDEAISLATDDFSQLPIRATFVKHTGQPLFQWVIPSESAAEEG